MNYELAKKLKDAGFPEQTRISRELNLHRYIPLMPYDAPSFPFLQELIAEIEKPLQLVSGELTKIDGTKVNGWFALSDCDILDYVCEKQRADGSIYFHEYIDTFGLNPVFGKTPEEAVANLWLELNKK
jgi:hypothetical protein